MQVADTQRASPGDTGFCCEVLQLARSVTPQRARLKSTFGVTWVGGKCNTVTDKSNKNVIFNK